MQRINKITILNILSTFILQGIAFLTTPIFTRLLGASQYGYYSLFNSWVLILTCIMGFSINSSIGTGLYIFKDKYLPFRNSVLLASTLICVCEFFLLFLFKDILASLIGFPTTIVLLVGLCSIGHYVMNFAQMAFIYEKKALSNFVLSVSVSFFSVITSILLINRFGDSTKYIGRILGVTGTYVSAGVIVWFLLFLKKPTGINKEYLRYGLVVGFPIIFHTLSQQILGQSDRVMMQLFGITAAEIGTYSLFYTLSSVLSTVLGALNNSWCPFYYDDIRDDNWITLNRKSRNYIELFSVLGVGFLLLSREVSYLMTDQSYMSGVNTLPILAFAVFFTFMYQFPVNFEFYHKKTSVIAIGTFGAGMLNIILNAFLIPIWGMYGAAIATALSYLTLFFAHYFIVTHLKGYHYHLSCTVFIPGIIMMIIGAIMFYVLSPWWYVRWFLAISLGCLELYRIFKRKSIF